MAWACRTGMYASRNGIRRESIIFNKISNKFGRIMVAAIGLAGVLLFALVMGREKRFSYVKTYFKDKLVAYAADSQ